MTLQERISLIRPGVDRGGAWADLGAGDGAFTAALAALLQPGAVIHAVDRDRRALASLERDLAAAARGRTGAPRISCMPGDFTGELTLPPLDGALVANALHFHADATGILTRILGWLKPGGVLIVVEYDIQRANPWVPHPLPWPRLSEAASRAGFDGARMLGTQPSAYHRSMYAAACAAPLAQRAAGV